MSVHLSPTLHARPLTPPNDHDNDIESALQFLTEDVTASHITPPNSSPLRTPQRLSKRVEFLPGAIVLTIPGKRDQVYKLKSILKHSSPLPTPDESLNTSYFQYQPGTNMLESAVQHLDSPARDARLDAYLAINGSLTAYDDLPSFDQWRQYLTQMQQYVLRDLRARDIQDSLATNTTVQAIKLAAHMINDEQIVRLLDLDFQSALLERMIINLGDPSKAVMKTALGFFSQQRLASQVLTSSRLEKLLTVLDQIDTKSKGVVIARLITYKRLVDRAPAAMLTHMSLWLAHILGGMLADFSDTRQNAIDLGNYVATTFGKHARSAEVLQSLFEVQDGPVYFEHFKGRLMQLLDGEHAHQVPQIWSTVLLFHQNKRSCQHWKRFGQWLSIIQACTGRPGLKQQTNHAWRKLVLLVQPDARTNRNMRQLLTTPIRKGFAKSGADLAARQSRQAALDMYYNLLHYALRPGLQHEDLDVAWDVYVVDLIRPMITASSKGRSTACGVLSGLLTANAGSWNADAALDASAILPKDLPRLDPRWIRSRFDKVLPLIEPILKLSLPASEDYHAPAYQLMHDLVTILHDASGQEIKMSIESKRAFANLLMLFRRAWQSCSDIESLRRLSRMVVIFVGSFSGLADEDLFADLPNLDGATGPVSPSTYMLSFGSPWTAPMLAGAIFGLQPKDGWINTAMDAIKSGKLSCDLRTALIILAKHVSKAHPEREAGEWILLTGLAQAPHDELDIALSDLTTHLGPVRSEDADFLAAVIAGYEQRLTSNAGQPILLALLTLLENTRSPIPLCHPLAMLSQQYYASLAKEATSLIEAVAGLKEAVLIPVLSPWLLDEQMKLNEQWSGFLVDRLDTILPGLSLSSLEAFLSCCLASTLPAIVEAGIRHWNEFYVLNQPSSFPVIEDALRTLAVVVQVNLPQGMHPELLVDLPYLNLAEKPIQPVVEHPSVVLDSQPPAAPSVVSETELVEELITTPDHSPPQSTALKRPVDHPNTRSRKRARHGDSQVDFVAIPPLQQVESQHLTEHQLDVFDQQQSDAVQYPELSSPARSADAQLREEEAAYLAEQEGDEIVVAGSQPRSSPVTKRRGKDILMRLRDVLAEFSDAKVSAKEERELDDLLFDLRCANHEAARRARS